MGAFSGAFSKVAKALGLTIPLTLLAIANEVIQFLPSCPFRRRRKLV
jgi:hypothetical protein